MAPNLQIPLSTIRRSPEVSILYATLMSIPSFTGFFGNLATIIAIQTTKELKDQIPNLFILFLAITDLITSTCVMIPSIIVMIADDWVLGNAMCNFHQAMNYYCVINTTSLLALISLDRALAITYPLQYPSKVTKSRVLTVIITAMVLAMTSSLTPVLMDGNEFDYWEANCGLPWGSGKLLPSLYAYVNYNLFIVIPQIVIIVCTIIIVRSAKKSNKNMQFGAQKDQNDAQEAKLVKSLIVLIIAYGMTQGIWASLRMLKVILPDLDIPLWVNPACTILLFFGSAVNPFIYAILRKDFRNAFKRLSLGIKNKITPFNSTM